MMLCITGVSHRHRPPKAAAARSKNLRKFRKFHHTAKRTCQPPGKPARHGLQGVPAQFVGASSCVLSKTHGQGRHSFWASSGILLKGSDKRDFMEVVRGAAARPGKGPPRRILSETAGAAELGGIIMDSLHRRGRSV